MGDAANFGFWSLLPLLVTLVLAFKVKDAAFSLFIGCIVGVVMLGMDPAHGFNVLGQEALGNEDFIWLMTIVIFIGIMFSFFKKAGVIREFADKLSKKVKSRRSVKFISWLLGLFIIDDYFSPLMTGVIMRPLSDKEKISREKLAYILDSTTASVCTLVPFMAWGAYIASLVLAQGGPVSTIEESVTVFTKSIPYNFYSIITVLFVLLNSLEILPDFGPMKKAETRAKEEGKVIRDGSTPMIGADIDGDLEEMSKDTNLLVEFIIPFLIIIGVAVGTFIKFKSIKIGEAFISAVLYLSVALFFTKKFKNVGDLMQAVQRGIVEVIPTIMILALAYCINTVTKQLGASNYIMDMSKQWMTPNLLVAISFLAAALMSFFTGTSWGTYALLIPFAVPMAYGFSGGELAPIVYQTIAAITGGGIFGDHASPVSDTTVLSSTGAGCDHMDHVATQLPYALTVGAISFIIYLII